MRRDDPVTKPGINQHRLGAIEEPSVVAWACKSRWLATKNNTVKNCTSTARNEISVLESVIVSSPEPRKPPADASTARLSRAVQTRGRAQTRAVDGLTTTKARAR